MTKKQCHENLAGLLRLRIICKNKLIKPKSELLHQTVNRAAGRWFLHDRSQHSDLTSVLSYYVTKSSTKQALDLQPAVWGNLQPGLPSLCNDSSLLNSHSAPDVIDARLQGMHQLLDALTLRSEEAVSELRRAGDKRWTDVILIKIQLSQRVKTLSERACEYVNSEVATKTPSRSWMKHNLWRVH